MDCVQNSSEKNARLSSFGSVFAGPVLSFFAEQLVDNAPKDGTLFFLAREGFWLEKAFKSYIAGKKIDRKSQYLLVSRAFLFKLLLTDKRSFDFSLKGGFSGSFVELMTSRFLLSKEQVTQVFDADVCQSSVSLPADRKRLITLFADNKEALTDIVEPMKHDYLAYLQSIGLTGKSTLNLVDLGYSGTIQSLLTLLLDVDTVGHYLIASNPGSHFLNKCSMTMKGYLKEGVKIKDGYAPLDRSMFLESLLTAPVGQFKGLRKNSFTQGFDAFYGRKVNSQRYFYLLEQVMQGALNYCYHSAQHDVVFTAKEVEMQLIPFLKKHNMIPKELTHIFEMDDDVAGEGTVNALKFFGLVSC